MWMHCLGPAPTEGIGESEGQVASVSENIVGCDGGDIQYQFHYS